MKFDSKGKNFNQCLQDFRVHFQFDSEYTLVGGGLEGKPPPLMAILSMKSKSFNKAFVARNRRTYVNLQFEGSGSGILWCTLTLCLPGGATGVVVRVEQVGVAPTGGEPRRLVQVVIVDPSPLLRLREVHTTR